MLNGEAADGLSGLLEWSEPIIYDRLLMAYRARLGDQAAIWKLARLHCRVWRALMVGDMGKFETCRNDLVAALDESRLSLDHLAADDAGIMMELLDVVMARYHNSMRTAKSYHLALIELATRLTPAPRHAA
jgi:hypothetical protein